MIGKILHFVFNPHKSTFNQEYFYYDFLYLHVNRTIKITPQNIIFKKNPNVLKLNIIVFEFLDISS